MHGVGWDVKQVALAHFGEDQKRFQPVALDCGRQFLRRSTGPQTNDEPSARFCAQHEPGLGFAARLAFERFGLRVVRMHLNGEPVSRVDELGQQRHPLSRVVACADEVRAELPRQFQQILAAMLAIRCQRAIVQFPGFAVGLRGWQVFAQLRVEQAPAPDFHMQGGLELQRIQHARSVPFAWAWRHRGLNILLRYTVML